MPKGSGIYEDEPREHRHAYSPGPKDRENELRENAAPDDSDTGNAGEPPD